MEAVEMKPRHRRIVFLGAAMAGLAVAAWLSLRALNQNLVFFFTPSQVARNETPARASFRIGGLVEEGTLRRDPSGLSARFMVTDTVESIAVSYTGILPDLFKEGRGCLAEGRLGADGIFYASQVLAKHDENYMPPEAARALEKANGS
jgi:cytochrome c-type biogenesis protein CcmE